MRAFTYRPALILIPRPVSGPYLSTLASTCALSRASVYDCTPVVSVSVARPVSSSRPSLGLCVYWRVPALSSALRPHFHVRASSGSALPPRSLPDIKGRTLVPPVFTATGRIVHQETTLRNFSLGDKAAPGPRRRLQDILIHHRPPLRERDPTGSFP